MALHTWLPVSRKKHEAAIEAAWADANNRLFVLKRLHEDERARELELHVATETLVRNDAAHWKARYESLLTSDAVLDRAAGRGHSLVGAILHAVQADDLHDVFPEND